MDAVEKDVRLLVKKELKAANQNFPMAGRWSGRK